MNRKNFTTNLNNESLNNNNLFSKSKRIKDFKKLYVNFNYIFEFENFQSKNEDCFKNYKLINQKFFLFDYHFQEFYNDLKNLLISLSACKFFLQKILQHYRHYNNAYLKCISIFS